MKQTLTFLLIKIIKNVILFLYLVFSVKYCSQIPSFTGVLEWQDLCISMIEIKEYLQKGKNVNIIQILTTFNLILIIVK